jgi:hypothetical protein
VHLEVSVDDSQMTLLKSPPVVGNEHQLAKFGAADRLSMIHVLPIDTTSMQWFRPTSAFVHTLIANAVSKHPHPFFSTAIIQESYSTSASAVVQGSNQWSLSIADGEYWRQNQSRTCRRTSRRTIFDQFQLLGNMMNLSSYPKDHPKQLYGARLSWRITRNSPRFGKRGPSPFNSSWVGRLVVVGVGTGVNGMLTNVEVMAFCKVEFFLWNL